MTTNRVADALAYGSVALIAIVGLVAVGFGPESRRGLLLLCSVAAVVIGRQSAIRDPSALTWALLASAPPIMALSAAVSPSWLIGPLAVLLLLAGELNALGWELRGAKGVESVARHRLLEMGKLGTTALLAALLVGLLPRGSAAGGFVPYLVAGLALVALGWVVFDGRLDPRSRGERSPSNPSAVNPFP